MVTDPGCRMGSYTLFGSVVAMTPCASKLSGAVYVATATLTDRAVEGKADHIFTASIPLGQVPVGPRKLTTALALLGELLGLILVLTCFLIWINRIARAKARHAGFEPWDAEPRNVREPNHASPPPKTDLAQRRLNSPLPCFPQTLKCDHREVQKAASFAPHAG